MKDCSLYTEDTTYRCRLLIFVRDRPHINEWNRTKELLCRFVSYFGTMYLQPDGGSLYLRDEGDSGQRG